MLRNGVMRKALVVSLVASVSGCQGMADVVLGIDNEVLTVVLRNDGNTNVHIWKAFGETGPHQGNRLEPGREREVNVVWDQNDDTGEQFSAARGSFKAGRTVAGFFEDLGQVTCSTPTGSGFKGIAHHRANPPKVIWNGTVLVCDWN